MRRKRSLTESLYLTSDGRVVGHGDPKASVLLAPAGTAPDLELLRRYLTADELERLCPEEPINFIGLDLGQLSDYSALAVVERRGELADCRCTVVELRRWPLHTAYEAIVSDVVKLLGRAPRDTWLMVDATGVGRPVYERIKAGCWSIDIYPPRAVTITAGNAETFSGDEIHVAKTALISSLAVLHQSGRLKMNPALPEAHTLERELASFRSKITRATNLVYDSWRQTDHDDLVLALALATWAAQHRRFEPVDVELYFL